MKIVIEIKPHGENADPTDSTGLTSEAYDRLQASLLRIGDIIDVRAEDTDE